MSTPNDVIIAAYGLSSQNRPGDIAAKATELLDVVTRAGRGLWAFAARINPEFFGTSIRLASSGPGWRRPVDAELVWRIELDSTEEVIVVPRGDLQADLARPSVWYMGQTYRPNGFATSPIFGNFLTFFYSQVFPKPGNIDANFSDLWPTQFDELLVREVGLYLALKDQRADEIPGLQVERDRWAQLFAAFLEHETTTRVYRYGSVRTFNVPALIAAHLAPAGTT